MSESQITVRKSTSDREGSCNACTSHTNIELPGVNLHTVYCIDLRSISVRVCPSCRKELIQKLQDTK